MTKTERIKQLEAQVKALEATITEQAIRIGMLEAQPRVIPSVPEAPWYRPVDPYCACGTSAVCSLHGMQTWSWDGSTVDSAGHVQ